MYKVVFCTLIIVFVGFTFINTQSNGSGKLADWQFLLKKVGIFLKPKHFQILEITGKALLSYLKLDDNATVTDICDALQKVLQTDLERQKKNGQSGVLPPNDPNHLWINECKKPNVTMESLLAVMKKQ